MHGFTAPPPSANRLRPMFPLGNRCVIMFCRSFNVTLPSATKSRLPLATGAAVASLKASPRRTITTSIGVEKQSVDDADSNVLPAASRRFKNPKRQTAYDHLLRVIHSDKGDQIWPSIAWSVLNISPRDRTLTYKVHWNEPILIMAYVPDEVDDDDEVENSHAAVQLAVCEVKSNGFRLGFGVRAFDREIVIDNVSFARHLTARDQHVFNFSKCFDGETQAAWYKYLAARLVKPDRRFKRTELLELYGDSRSCPFYYP